MLVLAITILFVLLGKASSVTISMKGFISKAFKASTRVKVTLIPKAIVSLLSLPSFLPSSSTLDFFYYDGPTDWVHECYNRQLEYQESLASYSKMRRKKYDYEYSPSKSRESTWYKEYVLNTGGKSFTTDSRRGNKFRRRFRLPYLNFNELMVEIRRDNWFPKNDVCDCRGVMGVPLELLVLGSLRYLGRGWTFDDLEEATGISEESHRVFFHRFISCVRKFLFPKWVKAPQTASEIEDSMSEYAAAGYPGCIGSTDASHIIIDKCYKHLKNQNLGGKSSQTTRGMKFDFFPVKYFNFILVFTIF